MITPTEALIIAANVYADAYHRLSNYNRKHPTDGSDLETRRLVSEKATALANFLRVVKTYDEAEAAKHAAEAERLHQVPSPGMQSGVGEAMARHLYGRKTQPAPPQLWGEELLERIKIDAQHAKVAGYLVQLEPEVSLWLVLKAERLARLEAALLKVKAQLDAKETYWESLDLIEAWGKIEDAVASVAEDLEEAR